GHVLDVFLGAVEAENVIHLLGSDPFELIRKRLVMIDDPVSIVESLRLGEKTGSEERIKVYSAKNGLDVYGQGKDQKRRNHFAPVTIE
ncbi:MAG: hypothetical protein V3V48_12445, partial [Candidatus Aminicenantaceae bacterium]